MNLKLLTLLTGILLTNSFAQARAVTLENGDSFRGQYLIETKTLECGYRQLPNILLGVIDVFASIDGVRLEAIIDDYTATPTTPTLLFDFHLENRSTSEMTVIVEYVSENEIQLYRKIRLNPNEPFTEITRTLTVDTEGNLNLTEEASYRETPLQCKYVRI